MYHDGEACRKVDTMCIVWGRQLDSHIAQYADELAAQYGLTASTSFHSQGAFNRCYEVRIKEKLNTIFRFPILGKVAFRKEKVIDEVIVMKYVSKHTSIPTPRLIRISDSSWGPCMVMELVEGKLLSDYLKVPRESGKVEILDPNIDPQTLTQAYQIMSRILIQLSQCEFPSIGGLSRDRLGHWCVTKRPMTLNANQLVSLANFPPADLPADTFATATDYFTALAKNHLTHLRTQRNDAVESEADCQRKYVARYLFLRIAKSFSKVHNKGPFRLICDDLRPSNVIVDEKMSLRCVIDWEFSYAAPAEFTYCSPWWLLLAHPDDWEDSLDSFLAQYLPRHETFLRALKETEDEEIRGGRLSESQRLSDEMARSMQNGTFWFCLAATSSFAFDDIYWRFIDSEYFGKFTSIEERIELLSLEERNSREEFVRIKLQQAEVRTLDEYRTLDDILAS
ncbi:hypothetical protein ABEF95_008980 [Exophiala dermatitidis]|uniref:Aminoglycoside phosphotransferase domain-containing protein n=2 Tax=Exophiala dermatitidis TaxID=5970 RepID=H6C9Y1_EXODN|nr:uncharacterized protein HMPREF1120_08736 [Exophiala dermatitidis NIH/UT8656]KAJ4531400.1 hypothetical protein HRR76_009058 [Exophiala dermatitidis]EHY60792.1 hypothetical protein HMPREF1120_08736 [Exophiala dermatitidis NIH/UT8656]KAJ4558562.1 hypothetical protein HRR77_000559 [Exophiala dermatitidis]KAJ4581404.1 hypothetical protein HRR79_000437 [Exophiala dermatitidis]KAJ4590279.1 hypothetical protein HRR82_000645 [Exophiala dermatitidis]